MKPNFLIGQLCGFQGPERSERRRQAGGAVSQNSAVLERDRLRGHWKVLDQVRSTFLDTPADRTAGGNLREGSP